MDRRQFTLFFLLIAGLALWGTRGWWLPPLIAQLPWLNQQADLIQAIEALVSLVNIFFTAVVAYLLWLTRRKPDDRRDVDLEVLHPTSADAIRTSLGQWGGRVNWIDRGATDASDLLTHGRLVIAGRSRLGKTREAAELIRRAVAQDVVPADCVYAPSPTLRYLAVASLTAALRRTLDPVRPALLFLDDLPYHFSGEGLERLAATLTTFKACKDGGYVVATARHDQLAVEHHRWLAQQGFHVLELPDLDAGQTGRLVDSAAGLFGLQLDDAGRQELVAHNNGTPHLPLLTLNLLREQGQTQVAHPDLQRVHWQTLSDGWAATRRYIVERHPVATFVLDALAHFHAADIPTPPALVLAYAAHRWRQQQRFAGRRWTVLRGALAFLTHFNVHIARDAISYPEEVGEGVIAPAAARGHVGAFLVRHRRYCHNRWLRRFHRGAGAQHLALFALANNYQACQEHAEAIRYYSAALRVIPYYASYNNRGATRSSQGDFAGAIADYDQAIALRPDYATAYNNRGNARRDQGDLAGAIADYDQTIALQPDYATAYNNRGNARRGQGDFAGAIADYDQTIALQPDYATAYNNRGIAHRDQGDLTGAIADYDQAIALRPDYATAYNNRGIAHRDQGDLTGAIADYDQAIALRPDYATAYYNRGNARRGQGDLAGAIADYDQAIALQPDNYLSWIGLADTARQLGDKPTWQTALDRTRPLLDTKNLYNAACFESVAGNIERALALLAQAVAQNQRRRAWARQDPDLHWLRHDPHFWEIVGKPAPEALDTPGTAEITT